MIKIFERELIYIWYSFGDRFVQIICFYLAGIAAVSLIGSADPSCRIEKYIKSAAPDGKGMSNGRLAVFVMAQILLDPQLVILSLALGVKPFAVRMISGILCCLAAGLLIRCFYGEKKFFDISRSACKDKDAPVPGSFLKKLLHNIRVSGPGFLGTLLVTTLILLYLPNSILAGFFEGEGALEVLKGEAVSIPLNVCGAGTVLIIRECIRCRHDHKPADALFLISVTRREICIK